MPYNLDDLLPEYVPIIEEVDLGDFREDWRGRKWPVLVNPERRQIKEFAKWGQAHPDLVDPEDALWLGPYLNLSPEDMARFLQKDRAFVNWMIERAGDLYQAYAEKNAPKPNV